MHPMNHEPRKPRRRAKRVRYRVVNHREAGLFDTMTAATLWALKNINNWDWWIEPVTLPGSPKKCAPINLGIEDEVLQNMPSEC